MEIMDCFYCGSPKTMAMVTDIIRPKNDPNNPRVEKPKAICWDCACSQGVVEVRSELPTE